MTKRTRAKEYSELVHIEMYGIFSVHTWGGYGYFITFSNDYSRLGVDPHFSRAPPLDW